MALDVLSVAAVRSTNGRAERDLGTVDVADSPFLAVAAEPLDLVGLQHLLILASFHAERGQRPEGTGEGAEVDRTETGFQVQLLCQRG